MTLAGEESSLAPLPFPFPNLGASTASILIFRLQRGFSHRAKKSYPIFFGFWIPVTCLRRHRFHRNDIHYD